MATAESYSSTLPPALPPCTVASHLQECMAVEHELTAWQKAGGFSEVGNALR